MAKTTEIRGTGKQRIIGSVAGWGLRLVGSTLRIKVTDNSGLSGDYAKPVLWAFWHNTVFVMPYVRLKFFRHRKVVVLTSASKDGAVLESAVKVCDIGAVRGSSSRRAVAALIALRKAIKEGLDVCITPDGPRGPKYRLQAGIIKMAEATGAPLVPIRVNYSSCWRLKTWDSFRIPKPFSQVEVILEKPMEIEQGLSVELFEEKRLAVERCMQQGLDDVPYEKGQVE
ncbi:lysophospholipid acyltransferase family protein [Rubritalea spongiae]|uniref:Lysophospholipid acyltransferase family protein n=1 Tax=Rubritalea spongiae TaxID=430797 RepID=A0ABW5DZD9_9BACT